MLGRQDLLIKLLNILGISETNKMLYVDDLERDEAKQKQILDLVDDIKEFFVCGKWAYFAKKDIAKPYMSLIKSILKYEKVNFSFQSIKDSKTQKTVRQAFQFY